MTGADELISKIKESLNNLVTLEIITAVGNIKVENNTPKIDYENSKCIMSKVDLLQGDIRTMIGEELLEEKYRCVREFHESREKEGHEIIKNNIETLTRLLGLAQSL